MRLRWQLEVYGFLLACGMPGSAWAQGTEPGHPASFATWRPLLKALPHPHRFTLAPTPVFCFEGYPDNVTNPGCFGPPAGAADCVSHSQHYLVQYIYPNVTSWHRLEAIGFISNDASTVFPSAGAFVISQKAPNSSFRFPTFNEITHLQAHNIQSAADTTLVVIDLRGFQITFADSAILALAVQFPEGGELLDYGVGPALGLESQLPDQRCDYLTTNTGQNWWEPHPLEHIDWAFEAVIESTTAIESRGWSQVKALYRRP